MAGCRRHGQCSEHPTPSMLPVATLRRDTFRGPVSISHIDQRLPPEGRSHPSQYAVGQWIQEMSSPCPLSGAAGVTRISATLPSSKHNEVLREASAVVSKRPDPPDPLPELNQTRRKHFSLLRDYFSTQKKSSPYPHRRRSSGLRSPSPRIRCSILRIRLLF